MRALGVTNSLLDWFKDYLTERQQRVVINGTSSEWKHIKAGVPQGSVLGPLLFLVYIDDLSKSIKSDNKLFADDTTVYSVLTNEHSVIQLHEDLNIISMWEKNWLQKFNQEKTESLTVSLKKHEPFLQNQQFIFKEQPIEDVNNHKHLGVVLSSNATWYDHILTICQAASRRINILRGLKHKLSRQALQTIYFSFIRPVFEYADVVWGSFLQT